MTALAIASGYWGGAGFILVPYDRNTAKPAPAFAEIVRAYDPDHVVSIELPWATFEDWYPNTIQIHGVDPAERLRLIENSSQFLTERAADDARNEVVSWCSPMRSFRFQDGSRERHVETVRVIRRRDPAGSQNQRGFAPAPAPTEWARLAAAESWRSDLGLLAAMRVGVSSTEGKSERPEPPSDNLGWLLKPDGDAPTSLIWNAHIIPTQATAGLETWFLADQRIIEVANFYLEDRGTFVVGDTGQDFALALAYDRLVGNGVWLTSAMLEDTRTLRSQVQPATNLLVSEIEMNGNHLAVTSSSVADDYLQYAAKKIRGSMYGIQMHHSTDSDTVHLGPPKIDLGRLEYIVNEHVGVPLPIPVSRDTDGSVEALSGLDTPIPANLIYPVESGRVPYWYVDVAFPRDASPRARDVPAHALVVEEGPLSVVNLRASHDGITIDPRSMGFVGAGSFLPSRVGRPRLRGLSMVAWVEAMAEANELGVRLSSAGRQAELIRRRLGSRDALLGLVTPQNVRMLRAFVPLQKGPAADARDPRIVVVDRDPYLTFEAMEALLMGGEEKALALVDQRSSARLLRRGLILGCEECGRPSFIDADRIGQQFECPKCAALNNLVSERWKGKPTEPIWFYDLYTAFRELLAANGDVVLLAARSLKSNSRSYMDAPELEFFDLDSHDAVAEVDVIASVDREVVLVEAKSNGTFKARRGTQTQKLLRVAEALRASRIVLATTKDHWAPADVAHLESEAAKATPFPVSVDVSVSLG